MDSERFPEIGLRLRVIRTRKQLTLRSLSALCGLSVGFLSQIERGLSSFSISSLRSICKALNVSLADILVMSNSPGNAVLVDPRHSAISKADNRSYVSLSDASVKYRFLSTGFPGRRFEAVLRELSAGGHSEPHVHEGEEFGYILEGEVTLTSGEGAHRLGPGDSYHLLASTPHACTAGKSGSKVLCVQTARYVRALSLLGKETLPMGAVPAPPSENGSQPTIVNLSENSIRYRFLSGNFPDTQLHVYVAEIPPDWEEAPSIFEGEEFGYVLKGRIHLTVDGDSYPLEPGDCYHIRGDSERDYRVDGSSAAKLLWVQMGAGSREADAVWYETIEKTVEAKDSPVMTVEPSHSNRRK
ncbi:MAG: cupin domain-containing protein [Candidatus Bipolaricaulota bacterium]